VIENVKNVMGHLTKAITYKNVKKITTEVDEF
jgi:hypothetical protein